MNSNQDNNSKNSWPVSAMIALSALILTAAVFIWVFDQQRIMVMALQESTNEAQLQHQEMHQQFMQLADRLQRDRQEEIGFMVKQQHYSDFMGLLSELYVNTEGQDRTALDESLHRLNQAFFGLEPFLDQLTREWLTNQIKAIAKLSNRLADSSAEYEENLLANKTSLRQMIDETHQKLYPSLFANQEQPANVVSQ